MSEKYQSLFTHEEIRKNKIKTFILLSLFIVIILILSSAIGYYLDDINQGLFIGAVTTAIVVPINILSSKLVILSSTKGRPIDIDNPNHMRLKNLVEGLAISAGIDRTPDTYILPSKIPNAFAGGFSPKSAYIGVTQGLLDMMNDSELEGVIAHEMSHIAQYDVLISTVAVSLFSVAVVLSDMLYRLIRFGGFNKSSSNSKSSNDKKNSVDLIFIIVIVAVVFSWFARLIGNLINLAISRKREYSADANAVRLCGYSQGLVSALSKLSNLNKHNNYSSRDLAELGGNNLMGLYIFNPTKSITNLFSTHPPIEDRISKLESMY